MRFETSAPPQWRSPTSVGAVMRTVLYALAPALLAHVWFFGIGILLNVAIALVAGLVTEAACLRAAGKPQATFLADGSTAVTAVLLAFCLPPLCPWWVTATGMAFAIGVAKHAYGGLGYNVFNPAMAGYVLVLVSFPAAMTVWPAPDIGDLDYVRPNAAATLHYGLTGSLPDGLGVDAIARSTTLDSAKEGLGRMQTMDEIRSNPVFGDFGGAGWEWIGNFVAIGGFALLMLGVIRWHTPAAVLGGLLTMATLAWLLDPDTHPSPGFHLFSGGAMLGAFFVATDPVSSPTTARGRLIYGGGIGVLTYLIRTFGSYPDGVAFAVLLMNLAVPLIERWTRPRVYGRPA
ncbi:MAG: RnfABCDGE type electron transport complex subunit D [Chromatiales bacterium]|nr:RnfABCDGE type electron transport complex subunit D [Chromatiales bacterium]